MYDNEEPQMSHTKQTSRLIRRPEIDPPTRKRYQKPALRYERVFETSALTCGKVQTTQSGCHQNRKTS
jgi:hypothetical protein